ncbi:MAG TPA: GNAT family N-acetyltransferase [Tepidisphaeraceae bacterium]|jgi:phosphinothricin acetyltransferase|nr:GNAT family N-acetyltransferase [Tepidisphaeraceae bacterium]
MSRISIRLAAEADLASMFEIYNHYVRTSVCTYQDTEDTLEDRATWLHTHMPEYFPATVAEIDGEVVGFGALSPFRERSAYRFTVENAVYVRHDMHRQGIGRILLADLIERSREIGHQTIIAVIDAEQPGSVALHRAFGFEVCGEMKRVGFKFDRWLDVVFMQLIHSPQSR